jgi:hypothetical protein
MSPSKLFLLLLILVSSSASLVSQASDGGPRRASYRYHTSYGVWDRSFYSTYSYSERTEYSSCGYNTCYYRGSQSWSRSDMVYVDETIVYGGRWDGYTRVMVYSDRGYSDRYASYYVRGNRVIYREYHHSHVYVVRPYTMTEAMGDVARDFDSDLRNLAIVGGAAIDIGISVAQIGAFSGNEDTAEVGLAIAGAGAVSASIASAEQNARNKARTPLIDAISASENDQNRDESSLR